MHPMLGINYHSEYIKVIRLLQTVSPIVNEGYMGCTVLELDSATVTLTTWSWQNDLQGGVIGIADMLILQYRKKFRGVHEEQ